MTTNHYKKIYCIYTTTLPKLFDLVDGFPLVKLDAYRTTQEEPPSKIKAPLYIKLRQHNIKSLRINYRVKKHGRLPSKSDLLLPLSQVDGLAIVTHFTIKLDRPYGELAQHHPLYASFKHQVFGSYSQEAKDTEFTRTIKNMVENEWFKKQGYKLSTLDLNCLQTEVEWKHPKLGCKTFPEDELLYTDEISWAIRETLRMDPAYNGIRTYRVSPSMEWELIKLE